MIRVLTVPHTGTRWLYDQLIENGIPFRGEHVMPSNGVPPASPLGPLPTIATLRDPLLVVLSHLNAGARIGGKRAEQERRIAWKSLARWERVANLTCEPFFMPLDRDAQTQVRVTGELMHWLWRKAEVALEVVNWAPRHTSSDTTGWKAEYLGGAMPLALEPFGVELEGHPTIRALFAEHGYELPWM